MAPKHSKLPAPMPVGLQRKRGADPPNEPEDWVEDPPTSGEAPTKKKDWWKTRQGRKGLARAAAHRTEYQWNNLQGLLENPFNDIEPVSRWNSPLEKHRGNNMKHMARLTLFCLQVIIRLVSHWVVGEHIEQEYGSGRATAPRMALLILREDMINDATWLRLTNMRRALFKRAMREGEDTKALKEALNQEDLMEKKFETTSALRDLFMTRVAPAVNKGDFPRLDFDSSVPLDKQYDNCWKDNGIA